jgi:enoyl-CoA hydratase/carnithine racemase
MDRRGQWQGAGRRLRDRARVRHGGCRRERRLRLARSVARLLAAAGGLYRLPRALPRNVAIEMAITGDPIDASRAAAFGLVNRVVPAERVLPEALALAARITRNAPVAVRESLQVLRRVHDLDEAGLRTLTHECRDRMAATDDFREGPRAFVERREPRWTGR